MVVVRLLARVEMAMGKSWAKSACRISTQRPEAGSLHVPQALQLSVD